MRINRFVLDCNIWISYLISRNQNILIDAVEKFKAEIFYCDELLIEIERVLQYPNVAKRNISIKEAIEFIKDVGTYFTLTYPIKRYIPTDKDDDYVIALALQTNSGFVTSGDSNILDEKENLEKKFTKLKIITKAEFESMFKGR